MYTIVLAKILFPDLVSKTLLIFFFVFAFVYTPLISFVNARLDGLVGQNVNIPYIKEATIFLSGFKGIDIWFVPFPLHNYGASAERFRQIELTVRVARQHRGRLDHQLALLARGQDSI